MQTGINDFHNTLLINLIDLLDNLCSNTKIGKLYWKVLPHIIPTDVDDIYITNIFNCKINDEIDISICFDLTNQFIKIREYTKSGLRDLNKIEIKNYFIESDHLSRTQIQDRMAILFDYIMNRRTINKIIKTSTTSSREHINELILCLEGLTSLFSGIWQQTSPPVDITNPIFKLTINEQ